ncbi:hypothetical protein L195_g051051, partial [Trifolium pratense]
MNFSSTAVAPPPVRTFDPQTPPVLKNVELYQPAHIGQTTIHHSSLPIHLTSLCLLLHHKTQMNLGHGHNLPRVAAPTSNPMGFMPIPSSAGVQRPGVGSSQPPRPPLPQPVQPAAAPAAPPPTVQTADTSRVP